MDLKLKGLEYLVKEDLNVKRLSVEDRWKSDRVMAIVLILGQ